MPRGSKLSVTTQVPGMDQDSISRKEYIARSECAGRALAHWTFRAEPPDALCPAVDVAVAGRIAEELLNGPEHLSDRTAEDLDRASKIANAMVRVRVFPFPLRHLPSVELRP
jgi:ATP-dependent Zn protease